MNNMPVGLLPDGAWFESTFRGEQVACGQKLRGDLESADVRVRLVRRWGKPVRDEQGWSGHAPVRACAAPAPDGPPQAAEAVAPVELTEAPQEFLDPFAD